MIYDINKLKSFNPKRKTFAVLGNPVGHSVSPELHYEVFRIKNLDYDYIKIQLSENEFKSAVSVMREKLSGFNLTIPFKSHILPFLESSEPRVSLLGACNTVCIKDGKMTGFNTDGYGFLSALRLSDVTLENKKVLLLGAGGAAASIAFETAQRCARLTCAARNADKAQSFVNRISGITGVANISAADISSVSGEFDIIINTTPLGMHPLTDETPVKLNNFTGVEFVYESIYNPPMTRLLMDARENGIKYDNGLSMLVFQGLKSEEHWNALEFSDDEIKKIFIKAEKSVTISRLNNIRKKSNIALIGFMGSGKTTIGKKLSKRLDMDFLDLDEKIEREQNMKISEIFEKYGESRFRELETRALKDCLKLSNTVISAGGGAVITQGNPEILKQCAFVVLLDTDFGSIVKNLEGSEDRPLLKAHSDLYSLYKTRIDIYKKSCDIAVSFKKSSDDDDRAVMAHI
jgi:shikimate dehydrogenase